MLPAEFRREDDIKAGEEFEIERIASRWKVRRRRSLIPVQSWSGATTLDK